MISYLCKLNKETLANKFSDRHSDRIAHCFIAIIITSR